MKTLVIAIGGNSLIKDAKHQKVEDQYSCVCETSKFIAELIEAGHRVVITHGNGPQVGFILLRSEYSRGILHEVPLDSIGADTQGAIGYQIQQAMQNELWIRGLRKSVVTVVTQTLVESSDPAFQKPTKPIGPFYKKEQADERMAHEKWSMVEDSGRGWRRVVPSPKPVRVIESKAIQDLVERGVVVVAAGGGGIPVVRDDQGRLKGVAAVIDKDYASAILAKEIGADLFIISTGVEQVCLNFGKPDQKTLSVMTRDEAMKYLKEGHFAAGSMKPKVEACLQFIDGGGQEALITSPEALERALAGKTGTRIVRS
ncbi:MAG TPA: carbamate kinase [Elusimicrobiota bacterium]|nr:carbamate kinase [Elusimicrobiota bacterium]